MAKDQKKPEAPPAPPAAAIEPQAEPQAPPEAPPDTPAAEPHRRRYEALMGISCSGPNGYRYAMAGELLEFSRDEAEPLLAVGAIKPAE